MIERYNSSIELKHNTKEEILPGFLPDFPYTATRSVIHNRRMVGWHWHSAVELFYIESGAIEYHTPSRSILLTEGCGGMVNGGVLHMTEISGEPAKCTHMIHFFDTTLITGYTGSRIDQKYISPISTGNQIEMIPLFAEEPQHQHILEKIKSSFLLPEEEMGFELKLRSALSDIWLDILKLPNLPMQEEMHTLNEKIKLMMIYIHQHFGDRLSIADISNAAYISERECYRTFQTVLHMTPNEYIRKYRLQTACRLLVDTRESVTNISQSCGFGSSSFFGKVFKESMRMTPVEYRNSMHKQRNIPS